MQIWVFCVCTVLFNFNDYKGKNLRVLCPFLLLKAQTNVFLSKLNRRQQARAEQNARFCTAPWLTKEGGWTSVFNVNSFRHVMGPSCWMLHFFRISGRKTRQIRRQGNLFRWKRWARASNRPLCLNYCRQISPVCSMSRKTTCENHANAETVKVPSVRGTGVRRNFSVLAKGKKRTSFVRVQFQQWSEEREGMERNIPCKHTLRISDIISPLCDNNTSSTKTTVWVQVFQTEDKPLEMRQRHAQRLEVRRKWTTGGCMCLTTQSHQSGLVSMTTCEKVSKETKMPAYENTCASLW